MFFPFLFFARYPVGALDTPMSHSQPPSVKYVYAIDYKSMIGGCRTLLVMNSVNPLLIHLRVYESCLSHVITSIEHPNSILDSVCVCIDVCIYIRIYHLNIYVYVSARSSSLLTCRTAVTCSMLYTQQYLFTVVKNKLLSIQCDTNVSQLVRRVIPGSYESLTSLGELSSSSLNRLSVCLSCLF